MTTVPMAGSQAPGFYRFKLGGIEVTLINDGRFQRPLGTEFVRNAELAQVHEALSDAFEPRELLIIPITTTVVNTGRQLVLFDAGTGGQMAPDVAGWMTNFRASGYAPEQVDLIIVSHFHGDHIQGIRSQHGEAIFPNAALAVPEGEWAFWMDDGAMSRAPESLLPTFRAARRVFGPVAAELVRFGDGAEIASGITAVAAPGHTPGHTAFIVSSGPERLLIWSDTTNKPELFVRHPEWQAAFDMDGSQAVATRLRMLDMAASERMPMTGYHFPFPATGLIGKGPDGYRFVPRFWHLH